MAQITKQQIAQILTHLSIAYGREATPDLAEIWWADFQTWDPDELAACIHAHRSDPEAGQYFPTLAHLTRQLIGSPNDIKIRAMVEFDNNPSIDGTSTWDIDRESYSDRERRRRAWINRQLEEHQQRNQFGLEAHQGARRISHDVH